MKLKSDSVLEMYQWPLATHKIYYNQFIRDVASSTFRSADKLHFYSPIVLKNCNLRTVVQEYKGKNLGDVKGLSEWEGLQMPELIPFRTVVGTELEMCVCHKESKTKIKETKRSKTTGFPSKNRRYSILTTRIS